VVVVVPDPEDPEEHRLVAQVKSNWSRRSPVERHVLREVLLDTRDPETGEQIVTSRMEFVEVAAGIDRDTILGSARRDQGEQVSKAADWLEGALADGEWHDSAGLKKLADGQDITERTLQRATQELEVEVERRGFPSSTYWRLPSSYATPYPHHVGATGDEGSNPHKHTKPERAEIQSRHRAMDVKDVARVDGRTTPLPRDAGFLDFILAAHRAGHVTTAEALEREQTHQLVIAASVYRDENPSEAAP
jgi:hypothetical protein